MMSDYDTWKTTRPDEFEEELPQEQCVTCQHWVDALEVDDDCDPVYPQCCNCGDTTCDECLDQDTDQCKTCGQKPALPEVPR